MNTKTIATPASPLPLILAFSVICALVAAFNAALQGDSLLMIFWAYTKFGWFNFIAGVALQSLRPTPA